MIESKATTSDFTESQEPALVKSAARLARYCAGLLADVDSRQAGWKIYYAVDSDIIGLYLAPERRANYADVFDRNDTLLARLIGDYLLLEFGAAEADPLFIVPPHDEQVARMMLRITEQYIDDVDEVDSAFGKLTSEKVADDIGAMQSADLATWLIENASVLIEVFDGRSGPGAELRRFTALGDDRLRNIEQYVDAAQPWAFPLPNPTDQLADITEFSEVVARWRRSLAVHRSRRQPRYSVDEDAIVLATIEWLNRSMEGDRRAIVLVTGTSGIWSAAASDAHRVTCGRHAGKRFSDAYIRHPQAFMANRDFFFHRAPGDDEPVFNLVAWLNLVFPNVLTVGEWGSAVADVSRLPLTDSPVAPVPSANRGTEGVGKVQRERQTKDDRTVISEWSTQVKAAAVARKVDLSMQDWSDRATQLLEWLQGHMSDGWSLERLRSDITSRAVQSLSTLYSSTVWLGLWSRLRRSPESARGIPALRFEPPYELAQECYRIVVDAMHADTDQQARAESLNLQEMFAKLRTVDDSNYLSHVIHALAYSTKGHWYATRTLCKIALRITKDLPVEARGSRLGREAAYLLAVAERRLARSIEDLATARQHLQDAIDKRDVGAPADLRFASEALSQDVAEFNFRYFVLNVETDVATAARSVIDRGLALLESIGTEPLPEVQRWVEQQIVTVILNVAMVAAEFATPYPDIVQRARLVLRYVHDRGQCREVIAMDGVAEFIHTAATAVFHEHAAIRRNAQSRLSSLPFPSSRPYDAAREARFKDVAMRV